jgi:NAD(P)-dependent dehydrogenase (short-subunit alcohol dehydrogenase family)
MSSKRLEGRIALVTGASRGIGRAVALRFAQEGAHVIAYARTQGALEELDDEIFNATGAHATLVAENLTDYEKIDRTGGAIFQRWGKLDIVVGGAAMLGQLSPTQSYTPKMWEGVFNLNVHANWRIIRSFDPLLRASDAGRAIFVTSSVAQDSRMYWGPYAASKAALEQMVRTYAAEIAHTKMKVNLLDPGRVRTRMRAEAFPGEDPTVLPSAESITGVFVDLAETACSRNGELLKAY